MLPDNIGYIRYVSMTILQCTTES